MTGEQRESHLPQEAIRSEGEILRGLKNSAGVLKTDFLAQRQTQPGVHTFNIAQHLDFNDFLQHVEELEQRGAFKKDPLKKALITYGSDPIIRFGIMARIAREHDELDASPSPQLEKQLRRDLHLGEILGMNQSANNPAFENATDVFNEVRSKFPEAQNVNNEQRIRNLSEQLRRTDPASIPDTDTLLDQMLELHNLEATANPEVAALIKEFTQQPVQAALLNRITASANSGDFETTRGLINLGEILGIRDDWLQATRDYIAKTETEMATNREPNPPDSSFSELSQRAERLTKQELDETPGLDMVVLAEQGKLRAEQVASREVRAEYQKIINDAIERYLEDSSLEGDFTVSLIRAGILNNQLPGLAVAIASAGLEILIRNGVINRDAKLEGVALPDRTEAITPGRRLMGLRGPSEEAKLQSEKDKERFSALRDLQTEVLSLYREAMGEPKTVLALFEKQAEGEELSDEEQRILDNNEKRIPDRQTEPASPPEPEIPPQGETLAERLAREERERRARGESDD